MKINDRFSTERDEWCWHLHETVMGQDEDGNPKEQVRTTYHANLSQVLDAVLDKQLGDADSLESVSDVISKARAEVNQLAKTAA